MPASEALHTKPDIQDPPGFTPVLPQAQTGRQSSLLPALKIGCNVLPQAQLTDAAQRWP